jgi:hypothetical protein
LSENDKLIFIYNADAGAINAIKDFFKKIIKPDDYECNLCGLTFGAFAMRKEWKSFVEDLPIPVEFLHRDEFLEQYSIEDPKFPSAYLKKDGVLTLLVPEEEMSKVETLELLIDLVKEKLKDRT